MTKVLVVDDEGDMVDIIDVILRSAGYETVLAYNGLECIEKTQKEKPDIILLDIRMPKMNGWETLEKLKKLGLAKKSKIIILTVEKGPGVEIFGLQDVVFDYITKPFEKENLLEIIRQVEGT